MTALINFAAIFERNNHRKLPTYVLALDIEKAYDSVDRKVLDKVMTHLGIANNNFYRVMLHARDRGYTAVKDGEHLSTPF
jgi:hypothetical protein